VRKQTRHRIHIEKFSFNKLNCVEGKQRYHAEVSNRFATLEILDAEADIKSTCQAIIKNIKISAKESVGYSELKDHKLWLDEGCQKLLDQRKKPNFSGYNIQVK
jgi:hypothetical protein